MATPLELVETLMEEGELGEEVTTTTEELTINQDQRDEYEQTVEHPYCEDILMKYINEGKIGQGTFGEVFKARDKTTKELFALKKILMDEEFEAFPITAVREIAILQLLNHENVVNLIEACRTKANKSNKLSTYYLVFELCDHDLADLLLNVNVKFSLGEIKNVIDQLLKGLCYIHRNKVLHRDIKPANVLLTKEGILKLADFGLARAYSSVEKKANRYTNRVVSLWYRPPELLLGERNYGPEIDLWSAGCIMAEMWTRSPIFQGSTEQMQLNLISQLCGSISPDVWHNVEKLELYNKLELPKGQKRKVNERLRFYIKEAFACDLLDKMLTLDPSQRIDADAALSHDYFWCQPVPTDLQPMLQTHTQSMHAYHALPWRDPTTEFQQPRRPRPPTPHPASAQYHHLVF